MDPGILVIEPADIREIDHEIRPEKQGDHGAQIVIVPELQGFYRHRIVFIDLFSEGKWVKTKNVRKAVFLKWTQGIK